MKFPTTPMEQFASEELEQPSYKFTLSKYLSYWYLFVLGLLLSIGGAYLFLRYTTPQYNISSLLLIKDKKLENTNTKNERFNDFNEVNSAKSIDNEIIVLKSVSLMRRALDELALYASYYVKGRVRNQEIDQNDVPFKLVINKLDSTAFDKSVLITVKTNNTFELEENEVRATHQFGQLIRKSYGSFTVVASPGDLSSRIKAPIIVKFHDIRKLATAYAEKLSVTAVNKQASILALNMTDAVPEKGVTILNKLVEVYNKEAAEDKNSMATNTISFIDERLKYIGDEVTNVEKKVEQFKQRNRVANVTSQVQQSLEEASGYNRQISDYGIQINVLESIQTYVSRDENQQQLIPGTLSVQDPTLSGLIARFNELQLDRERMLRTVEASNPVVENMNEQLANLRANIQENLASVKNSLNITRRNLQAKSGQFGSRMQEVPTIERGLVEISREQELKNALYLFLLQKREEAALTLAATVSNSRVIDPAIAGDKPVSPQKPAVALIALLLGLGLPFAYVYVKQMLNDRVELLQDVERSTSATILGELAHNKSGEAVVITKDTRSPIAEMFRLIRTNFQFATVGKPNKVILVTSSMSGEGKTFFSRNLGASLVLAGKVVVVINMDLRKQTPDTAASKGLTDYLVSDTVSVDDIVQPSQNVPGLYVIGSGMLPPNPAELMMSPKVGQLLNILKESFDYIIIDTAPVGQVADAFTLAPLIDATIYLIRYNYTYKAQIEIINKIRFDNKLNNLMLVLNDARRNNSYSYGYGNGYGYNESGKKEKKNLV